MGSWRMTVTQALFLSTLSIGLIITNDWEKENFGIRTSHHEDELLNKVAPNAPRLESRRHRFHHRKADSDAESRKTPRVRDRSRSLTSETRRIDDAGVRVTHRGQPMKPSMIEDDKISSSLVRSKPNFARFKADFMEQLSQPKDGNPDQTHFEKDMTQDHTELAPLFSTQEPIVKSEGHQMKESQQQNIRPRHKVRIRQRAGPKRPSVSEGSKSGASLDISSRRASVTRQANRRISQPNEIGSNEIADVARPKQSRIRMKRPSLFKAAQKGPGVRGRPRPSHSGRDSPVFKSIKKMRIRNRNRGIEDSSVEITEALTPDISEAVSTLRPRLASRRKASLTSQTSSFRKPEITTRRLALSTRRQTSSEATESSSVTSASSEAPITVSPKAHIIRYTLDSSEVTSELSTRPEMEQTENLTPRAEKLVASMAIPSDIFSLATHTLMKHTSTEVTDPPLPSASEVFLPTFRPKKHKKRGRFILAATSHGK